MIPAHPLCFVLAIRYCTLTVIVFGDSASQARAVAAEIAHKAYWNSSYFGGTFRDLAGVAAR